MKSFGKLFGASLLVLSSGPAFAHTGGDLTVLSGLLHPVTGLDHLLAMLGVGVLAVSRSPRQGMVIVGAFLAALFSGSLLGMAGLSTSLAEPGVLGSLVVFGALIAAGNRVPFAMVAGITGFFGLAHGFAHGVEAVGGTPLYLAAFLAASSGLHGAGYLFGHRLAASAMGRLLTGAVIGASGLALSLT